MTARRRTAGDEGTTLMELMVGMTIMSIFMAMFTAAVVTMFSSTNKIQAVVSSSTQLNLAFERLDTQVRYAVLIVPDPSGLSVAFQTDGPTSTTCRRVVVGPANPNIVRNGIVLNNMVEGTWTTTVNRDGSLGSTGPETKSVIATGIALVDQNGTPVKPFTAAPAAQQIYQQLVLRLVGMDGNGQSLAKSFSEVTFSALNSGTASRPRVIPNTTSFCATEPTP
jgi:type II secretory pathway pseudopilin PulG